MGVNPRYRHVKILHVCDVEVDQEFGSRYDNMPTVDLRDIEPEFATLLCFKRNGREEVAA